MTKTEIKERGLTLFATGKFDSRQSALVAAKEELKRMEANKVDKAEEKDVDYDGKDQD